PPFPDQGRPATPAESCRGGAAERSATVRRSGLWEDIISTVYAKRVSVKLTSASRRGRGKPRRGGAAQAVVDGAAQPLFGHAHRRDPPRPARLEPAQKSEEIGR